jgi:hypothetical protein
MHCHTAKQGMHLGIVENGELDVGKGSAFKRNPTGRNRKSGLFSARITH